MITSWTKIIFIKISSDTLITINWWTMWTKKEREKIEKSVRKFYFQKQNQWPVNIKLKHCYWMNSNTRTIICTRINQNNNILQLNRVLVRTIIFTRTGCQRNVFTWVRTSTWTSSKNIQISKLVFKKTIISTGQ